MYLFCFLSLSGLLPNIVLTWIETRVGLGLQIIVRVIIRLIMLIILSEMLVRQTKQAGCHPEVLPSTSLTWFKRPLGEVGGERQSEQ